ncbi:MAG: type IX secretion system membrane protein PorP/SprF [Bacteroidetes bacterium]|nr:type IX secretion system membrane protein PorP/SprF [Bacteroidota bacterium]
MKTSKKILCVVIVALAIITWRKNASAQQDPMYTQYIDNLLVINPAFAGSQETGKLLLVSRNQWVSFPGAPTTKSFSYHAPLKTQNVGIGFSILNDKVGPQKQTGAYFDYSRFFQVSEDYKLGMGLKGGVSFYRAALTELNPISPDPIYSQDIYKNLLPNFGVGFYLFSNNTYFGFSAPNLIKNSISRNDYLTESVQKEEIHFYFVGGRKFQLGQNIHLKTYSMLRYVRIAPVTIDITALFGFKDKFWFGGMFRLGDSYGIIAQFKAGEKMLIGYSYDLTYSELNAFNNGTHEIMFSYDLNIFK